MELDDEKVYELGRILDEEDVIGRHQTETRREFETVYDIPVNPDPEELERAFKLAIQARAQPLNRSEYKTILENIDPNELLELSTRKEAFENMICVENIGQKVANEFLRIAVDVLKERQDWRADLHVALDTNVVQALVKTEAILLDKSERERSVSEIVNMNPESDPDKLVGYSEIQNAFEEGADRIGELRIVYDELWTEHRSFISNSLLQDQSVFADELVEWARN